MKKLICPECGDTMLNPICKSTISRFIKRCLILRGKGKCRLLKEYRRIAKEHKLQSKGWCANCKEWRQT